MTGNGNACTITLSAAALGGPAWPAGATFAFSGGSNPAVLAAPNGNVDFFRTLTVTMPSATTPATYNFRVTATPSGGCGWLGQDGDGSVVVSAAVATTTSVASSTNPSTYGGGVTFTATVTRTAGSGTPSGSVRVQGRRCEFRCSSRAGRTGRPELNASLGAGGELAH